MHRPAILSTEAALFPLCRCQGGSGCGKSWSVLSKASSGLLVRSDHRRQPGERDDRADAAGSSMVVVSRAPLVIAAATAVAGAGVRRVCWGVRAQAGARRAASRRHRHGRSRIRSAGARSRRRPGSQSHCRAARQKRPADRQLGAAARAFAAAGCQRASSTGLSPFSAPPRRRRRSWSGSQTVP